MGRELIKIVMPESIANYLDENTHSRLMETIDIHLSSKKLLADWKQRLMEKCRACLIAKRDKTVPRSTYSNKCDCDVQFFLDEIVLLLGNGYAKKT